METKLKRQPKTVDDIKYIVDTIMIEEGFSPVSVPDSLNMDCIRLGYKCKNKNCMSPYGFVQVTGLEELQNNDRLRELFEERCRELIGKHDCKKR